MAKDKISKVKVVNSGGPWGLFFVMAYIGAAIYFIQTNEGFWGFILGLLQGLVWPVYVLHAVLKLLAV
jgi:hypothetical protein